MSEDLSAMIRVGVTIILVASVVATVLSLVVVAQSIISSGTAKLQTVAGQISVQDFEQYNQHKVTGIQVKSAIQLYENQDISVCVKTKRDTSKYNIYGAVLEGSTAATNDSPAYISASTLEQTSTVNGKKNPYYTLDLKYDTTTSMIEISGVRDGITLKGTDTYIYDQGNFMSRLIKDTNEEIVGIAFEQID